VALLLAMASVAFGHEGHGRIRHVVIVYQENHSFDNVFGRLCLRIDRCNGSRKAELLDGSTLRLATSPDIVPQAGHTTRAQTAAINGGLMNGWEQVNGCSEALDYGCLTQYSPSQIPNLSRLARRFVISDRTFQMDNVSSWGAHLELVAATLDGFLGDRAPQPRGSGLRRMGWGCDSGFDARWQPYPGGPVSWQPSCVPDYGLDPVEYPYGGAYRPTEVEHVPTIMDSLDRAGLRWTLYTAARPGESGYGWAICPTFAGCLYTRQRNRQVGHQGIIRNARAGKLPNFSVVLPTWRRSQHNDESMAQGDNWVGRVVRAIGNGPDWRTTAIFITYDDCGCFYDHVPPPEGLGIRTPMVIVSPWAKPQKTDSHTASVASMLAFTERVFDLPSLTEEDAAAYDYRRAFDFHQRPLDPIEKTRTRIGEKELEYLRNRTRPRGGT